MRRLLLALIVVSVSATPARAQSSSLSGIVVDQSDAVVPGAMIILSGPGGSRSAISGPNGAYAFRDLASGTYRLTVTLAGFAPATRDVAVAGGPVEVTPIMLTAAPVAETVVVSASKVEDTLAYAPATMSVVTADVIATTSAQNYADLLRAVPGVNVIQMSARDFNLTSRQATSALSNTELVLLDGRSIYQDFFGFVLWDFVPSNVSDIKQIEVVRGPASVVWGANALNGVVNIITKSPREAPGTTATLSAGLFSRDAGSTAGLGPGATFGANASVTRVPDERWSYRISAGYFHSDPLPRPSGRIPLITDPRDPTATVGGALYPADGTGPAGAAFSNSGTSQPKFDVRVDQEIAGGRVTYAGGVAGTSGIAHTAIGPFDIQSGSYMGYASVNYRRGTLKLSAFTNMVDTSAPNLLLIDPTTGKPLQLNLTTQTYDVEVGDLRQAGRHVLSFGGNVRRNNFDISIAPAATGRTELGGYLQDEIVFNRWKVAIGGRVDKFGNLGNPAFSPRVAVTFAPIAGHTFRVSYNKAFLSPSAIDNFLDIKIIVPTDLSALAPLLPATLQPLVRDPFPLVVRAVGSALPIGGTAQPELTQESLTAYEVAYTAAVGTRTTLGVAAYVNDLDNNINFAQIPAASDPYTAANPPPGWPLPPSILTVLAQQGILLPQTGYSYRNLGPRRDKGVEVSVDHRVSHAVTASANYSFQARPTILAAANPFPATQLTLPPTNRLNAGLNFNGARFLGSASVNHADKAFWSDVLGSPYHGFSDAYTMVNGSFGVKWSQQRITTLVKVTNLFNQDIQQHVFGDVLKRSGIAEVRFNF
jgi:outer membrane receptor protein involved in Fe transport